MKIILRNVVSPLRRLKWLLFSGGAPEAHAKAIIHPMARFTGHVSNIIIQEGAIIEAFSHFHCNKNGKITIGRNTYIASNTLIHTGSKNGIVSLGDDCTLQTGSIIYGHGGCQIGNGVRIAAQCVIIPTNHNFDEDTRPIYQQGRTSLGIHISNDVWIGAGTVITDGCSIGSGSVIGAGSVVTRSIDANSVMAGVPARKIRSRSPEKYGPANE